MKISMEWARSCCQPKQRPWLRSISWSFTGLQVKIRHGNKTGCSKSNPVQSSISKSTTCPRKERASAQIRIEQHSDFRWRRAKAWKRCLAWFWIDCNQSLQPNQVQMKCYAWKRCNEQPWQEKLRFSIWRFSEQPAFVNNHLLCYWPTIHHLISKICPKFQVLSSHFF